MTAKKYYKLFILLVLLASCILWLIAKFTNPNTLPIKKVAIEGTYQHVNQVQLKQILMPLVDKGFFSINVESIQNKLLQQPWVAGAQVKRIWPNKIKVKITEQQAVAEWNNKVLINLDGNIFSPPTDTFPANIARLAGPNNAIKKVFTMFNQFNYLIKAQHLSINSLQLTPQQTWNVELTNGLKIFLGQKQTINRLKRFLKVYSQVVDGRANEIEYIDLRYPNGLAVRWRQPEM